MVATAAAMVVAARAVAAREAAARAVAMVEVAKAEGRAVVARAAETVVGARVDTPVTVATEKSEEELCNGARNPFRATQAHRILVHATSI